MQSETALIGAYSAVELYSVAAVYLNLAVIIHPRNSEHNYSLRLNESFEKRGILILGMLIERGLDGLEDLGSRLYKLRLARMVLL